MENPKLSIDLTRDEFVLLDVATAGMLAEIRKGLRKARAGSKFHAEAAEYARQLSTLRLKLSFTPAPGRSRS